jgi:hypothetical protein
MTWSDSAIKTIHMKPRFWVLDPKGWPADFVQRMDKKYIWALMAATASIGEGKPPSTLGERDQIAERFKASIEEWDAAS